MTAISRSDCGSHEEKGASSVGKWLTTDHGSTLRSYLDSGVRSLDAPESSNDHFGAFSTVLSALRPSNLLGMATNIRGKVDGHPSVPAIGIGDLLCGSHHILFPIEFEDGVKWILKVPGIGTQRMVERVCRLRSGVGGAHHRPDIPEDQYSRTRNIQLQYHVRESVELPIHSHVIH